MPQIPIDKIRVGYRFREKFEDIESLATSISRFGLLNPIVVDEDNNLIAGERRLKAHQLLGKQEIEVKFKKDLTDLEKKEIELEENIQRKAFTWQEEVMAKKAIHTLKQEIHGAGVKGRKAEGAWGMRDTAKALGESLGTVTMDVQLARGLKAFPELQKENSKTTAYKKLKLKQKAILNQALMEKMKERGVLDHPDIIHGSCLEYMAKMEPESVDLILSDPPYGIDMANSQTMGRQASNDVKFEDGEFETLDLLDKAFALMYKVLKTDRHMYIFGGIDKVPMLIKLLEKHGFEVHRLPLIWDKGSGSYPSQMTTYVHSYEIFLHVWKGKHRKLNGTPRDVFQIKRTPSNKKIHPTEKPTELLRDLINLSSLPGETVFDPFAGSGSTLIAAKETNRRVIGVELNDIYYKNICERLGNNENVSK